MAQDNSRETQVDAEEQRSLWQDVNLDQDELASTILDDDADCEVRRSLDGTPDCPVGA